MADDHSGYPATPFLASRRFRQVFRRILIPASSKGGLAVPGFRISRVTRIWGLPGTTLAFRGSKKGQAAGGSLILGDMPSGSGQISVKTDERRKSFWLNTVEHWIDVELVIDGKLP